MTATGVDKCADNSLESSRDVTAKVYWVDEISVNESISLVSLKLKFYKIKVDEDTQVAIKGG